MQKTRCTHWSSFYTDCQVLVQAKFEYVQSFFIRAFRDEASSDPAGSTTVSSGVFVGGSELVFLHSSDHHELWSHGN